jgi:hypothetical protein
MTCIVVKDGIMVADGMVCAGALISPLAPGHNKIIRLPDGGLVGASGGSSDIHLLFEWCLAGMPADALPKLAVLDEEKEGCIDWLWLKPDGTLWRAGPTLQPYPISSPSTIGCATASYLAEGAMMAGLSAEKALLLIIPRCRNIGLPVQVERLTPG